MTDKYSFAKCEQYGRRLAARLCEQHFSATPDATLDGPTILSFTPVRQVNLLVVRQLLQQWQAEISRLRSPYFDFEAPAVQTALTQFQNTLSRYIRLNRSTFEPLLAHAAADALYLVADPAGAFSKLWLTNTSSALTTSQLQASLRYLEVNKDFFTAFLTTLPAEGSLSADEIISLLHEYQQANYRPHQSMQLLVSALRALLPLTEADLREDGPISITATSIAATPSQPKSTANTSPGESAPLSPTPTFDAQAATVRERVHQPVVTPIAVETSSSAPIAEAPLHEKLKASQAPASLLATTLRAAQSQPIPLAERSAPKVETLREAISINQRFSFINELFNGENMEYHAAIQHLDSLSDFEQAQQYVTQNLAQRYDWSRKEEHVNKLLKLVDRKFASV